MIKFFFINKLMKKVVFENFKGNFIYLSILKKENKTKNF